MATDLQAPPGAAIYRDPERAAWTAEMMKAIAHPVRLRIVALLCGGPRNVTDISEQLEVKQSIVSQQLRILRMNSLVAGTKRDGFTFYSLAQPRLTQLVSCMEGCRVG